MDRNGYTFYLIVYSLAFSSNICQQAMSGPLNEMLLFWSTLAEL